MDKEVGKGVEGVGVGFCISELSLEHLLLKYKRCRLAKVAEFEVREMYADDHRQ